MKRKKAVWKRFTFTKSRFVTYNGQAEFHTLNQPEPKSSSSYLVMTQERNQLQL